MRMLYPSFCYSCAVPIPFLEVWCSSCTKTLHSVIPLSLKLTKGRRMQVYAYAAYQGIVKDLIRAKYHKVRSAAHASGLLLASYYRTAHLSYDYLLPISMHWRRWMERGYNQTVCMARVMGQGVGVPLLYPLVKREHQPAQVQVAGALRRKRMKDSFAINEWWDTALKKKVKNTKLLIIDDTYTTGATAHAYAHALLPLRPAQVDILVVARSL